MDDRRETRALEPDPRRLHYQHQGERLRRGMRADGRLYLECRLCGAIVVGDKPETKTDG